MIKNIGFFINNFDHGNGTERCTQLIANGLSKHNYNVYIISLYHGESPCLEVDHKITLLSVHRELMGTRCFIKKNRIVKDVLTNFINIYNIELVVVVDVALYKYIYRLQKYCNIKVVAWEHFNCKINRGFWPALSQRLAVHYADRIIVLGEKDLLNYQAKYPNCKKIERIYNPLMFNESHSINVDNKCIIAVGRLERQKGFDLLIKAWHKIEHKFYDWQLMIFGDGTLYNDLQKKINRRGLKNIHLKGYSSNIDEEFKKASIFVLSSRFEGFGLVLIEAQAKSLPCVSFVCPEGPSEIIENNVNGFLVKPKNINELAEKLEILMSNRELRKQFSDNSQNNLSKFDIDIVLGHWINLIKTL